MYSVCVYVCMYVCVCVVFIVYMMIIIYTSIVTTISIIDIARTPPNTYNTTNTTTNTTIKVIATGELPGPKVEEALRAVAYQVALGTLPADLTSAELVAQVLGQGDLAHWAHTQPKHTLIS